MDEIRKRQAFRFKNVFGVPLSQYWDDNRGGFQIVPFMTQVLEYEGPWTYNALSERFGRDGIESIRNIMKEVMDWWTLPF